MYRNSVKLLISQEFLSFRILNWISSHYKRTHSTSSNNQLTIFFKHNEIFLIWVFIIDEQSWNSFHIKSPHRWWWWWCHSKWTNGCCLKLPTFPLFISLNYQIFRSNDSESFISCVLYILVELSIISEMINISLLLRWKANYLNYIDILGCEITKLILNFPK